MSTAPFGRYFEATKSLRRALVKSRRDKRFAEAGGVIVYIIDTNIVEAFLRSNQRVLIKERDADISVLFSDDAASIVERLTAYFLFEGDLPGQKGASVYQSPAHWNETLHRVDKLAATAIGQVGAVNAELSDEVYAHLRPLAATPEQLITRAEELGVARALQKLAETVSLTRRIKRLWQEGPGDSPRLQSLQQSPYWTAAIDYVRREDFGFWFNRLKQRRGGEDKHQLNENDAMTLAVFQALYREHPEAIGPRASLRFQLITADGVLATVVEENSKRLEQEGIGAFVRPPTVYIPLLNFDYMNRLLLTAENRTAVSAEIDSAVKALLPFDRNKHQAQSVSQNVKRWSEVARRVAIVSARHFKEDFGENSDNWRAVAALFQSPEVVSTAGKLLRETITEIKSEHTQQATGAAIARLASRLRSSRRKHASPAADSRLFPKFLEVEILRPLKGLPGFEPQSLSRLDLFISALRVDVGTAHLAAIDQVVDRLKATWRDSSLCGPSYLLASSIYFSTGAWESARLCAELCRRSLRRSEKGFSNWEREARYAEALALRMTMRSRTELDVARRSLLTNMAAAKSRLAHLRDRVELSALMLTASVVQWIENASPMDELGEDGTRVDLLDAGDLTNEFEDAVAHTREALDELRNNHDDSEPNSVSTRIRVQGGANLLGAAVFTYFHSMESGADLLHAAVAVESARAEFDELLRDTNTQSTLGMEVYTRCARLIGSPSSEGVERFRTYVSWVQSQRELSAPDKIEQDFLADRANMLAL